MSAARRGAMEAELPPEEPAEEEPADLGDPPVVEGVTDPESENYDPNAPLWEGGPTGAVVDSWKAAHGKIYVTSFGPEEHFIWRTLTRYEYRQLVKQLEQGVASGQITQAEANMNNEEAICERVLLFPAMNRVEMAKEMAGVASIISQEVMEASAFVASDVREL